MPLSRRMLLTSPPIMQDMKSLGSGAEHDLSQGVPFFDPPGPAVEKAVHDVGSTHRYGPDGGDQELIDEISVKLARENGIRPFSGKRIMVTAGANMAFVNAAAAVCDPGDEMLLLSPYYFNHFMTLDMLGIQQRICPLSNDLLPDPGRIAGSIGPKTRAVVIVSPNNPSGMSYPAHIIDEIVQICKDRGIWLISDETYDRFVYGSKHTSPGALDPEANVISLFSFSKVFGMSGWRIGYMAYPEILHESLMKVQDTTVICPSRIAQRLAYHCLKDHSDHVDDHLEELDASRRKLIKWLSSKRDIYGPEPNGAFYLFFFYTRDSSYENSLDLATDVFKRTGVLLVPGDPFGAADPPSLRISYGNIRKDGLSKALSRLDSFFD